MSKVSDADKAGLIAGSRLANQIPDFNIFWDRVMQRLDIEEGKEVDEGEQQQLVKPRKINTV